MYASSAKCTVLTWNQSIKINLAMPSQTQMSMWRRPTLYPVFLCGIIIQKSEGICDFYNTVIALLFVFVLSRAEKLRMRAGFCARRLAWSFILGVVTTWRTTDSKIVHSKEFPSPHFFPQLAGAFQDVLTVNFSTTLWHYRHDNCIILF